MAAIGAGAVLLATSHKGKTHPTLKATSQASSTHPARQELTVGDSATLKGERAGESVQATLVSYKERIAAGEYDNPQAGMKFVGVTLRLMNVGSAAYADAPSNGATILTATGVHGKATIIGSGECSEGFAASVKIAPNESQEGCIAFELPQEDSAARFQWTPASGFGDETAEWTITPPASSGGSVNGQEGNTQSETATGEGAVLGVLDKYWADIKAHHFAAAYGYLVPGAVELTESQFISSEEHVGIEGAEFHGQVSANSGSSATVGVVSLTTHDAQYGCRTWSGSYTMTHETGGWRIEHAALTPQPCG